jgi:hypothetical protein
MRTVIGNLPTERLHLIVALGIIQCFLHTAAQLKLHSNPRLNAAKKAVHDLCESC